MKHTISLPVVALVLCSVFALPALSQPITGMVSPTNPARADTDGDGPDPGDPAVVPNFLGGTTYSLVNPWSCGGVNNSVVLSNMAGDGRYRTLTRPAGSQTQTADIDVVSGVNAIHMQFAQGPTVMTGSGGFVDTNSDGIYDQIVGDPPASFAINLSFFDSTGDGWADWVSIPWAQSSTLGVNFSDSCGVVGANDPQVWIPLADTNGDGRGDTVVFDIQPVDNLPDATLLWGPIVAPAMVGDVGTIPTLSTVGMIFLAIGLALAGAFLARGSLSLGA